MITKEKMMDLLVAACPTFEPRWHAFQEEWRDEGVDLPHYLVLADFARHLIKFLEQGVTTGMPAVFEVIEQLHLKGEPYVKVAATVGLLESLQNLNLHTSTMPDQFLPFLRPVSRMWWDKLYRFWDHGELLTED